MSVRLDEWMELETYDSRRGSFPDMPVSHWAADYIQEASRNGWIVGLYGRPVPRRRLYYPRRGRNHRQPDVGPHGGRAFLSRHHEDELTHLPRPPEPPITWAYYDLMSR